MGSLSQGCKRQRGDRADLLLLVGEPVLQTNKQSRNEGATERCGACARMRPGPYGKGLGLVGSWREVRRNVPRAVSLRPEERTHALRAHLHDLNERLEVRQNGAAHQDRDLLHDLDAGVPSLRERPRRFPPAARSQANAEMTQETELLRREGTSDDRPRLAVRVRSARAIGSTRRR